MAGHFEIKPWCRDLDCMGHRVSTRDPPIKDSALAVRGKTHLPVQCPGKGVDMARAILRWHPGVSKNGSHRFILPGENNTIQAITLLGSKDTFT